MVPSIARAVLGRLPRSRAAQLPGFAAYLLRGEVYPGAVSEAGARLTGTLYDEVSSAEWGLLDVYEGEAYVRTRVEVVTSSGAGLSADCYLVHPERRGLLSSIPWDLARFVNEHAAGFGSRWS